MTDLRCKCNKLLFKYDGRVAVKNDNLVVEIKCPRCGELTNTKLVNLLEMNVLRG